MPWPLHIWYKERQCQVGTYSQELLADKTAALAKTSYGPIPSVSKSCTSCTDPVFFSIFWKRWKQGGFRSCLCCFNVSQGSSPSLSEVITLLTQSHFTLLAPSKFLPSMLQNKCDHTDTLNRTRQFSQEQISQCYCAHYLGLSVTPQSSTFLLFFLAALLLYPSLLSSCTTNHISFYLSTLSSLSVCMQARC